MSLTLRVITPDKTIWDDVVEEVVLPSITGQVGILGGHAPLLTALDIGVLRVRPGKEWKTIALMGGFAEVENNLIKVLVNAAQLGEKIDKDQAKSEYEAAQKTLASVEKGTDRLKQLEAQQSLKKARARFQAAGGVAIL